MDKENQPIDNKVTLLSHIKKRYNDMQGERSNFENERRMCEEQVASPMSEDNEGKPIINPQTEQTLIEMYVGRNAGDLKFDVKPYEKAISIQDLQASKYVLDFFLNRENFWKELQVRDYDKAKYGTAVRYCGLRMESETVYEPKKDSKISQKDNVFYTDSYLEKSKREKRFFTPKNINIRDIYFDDRAVRQPDFAKVEDLIYVEWMTKDHVIERRGGMKGFDTDNIEDMNRETGRKDQVKVRYYYNRITKQYAIVANESILIYDGLIKYKNGKLPFYIAQHYQDNDCLYGKSIPRKVRPWRAYKRVMLQSAMDKVYASAYPKIILGNGNNIDGDFSFGNSIDIRQTTESPSEIQQFQFDGNITNIQNILQVIDDEIRQDSGEDPRASFASPEATLGQTEIVEENKAIRVKSIEYSRDISLDYVLTYTLENIQQFAPVLSSKKTKVDGVTTLEFPVISIPGVKVVKKGGKQEIVETKDYGQYGFFELSDTALPDGAIVNITTPSTYNKNMKTLEKNRVTEFVNNMKVMAEMYGPEILQQIAPAQPVREFVSMAYDYDPDNKYAAQTKKDLIKKKNLEKVEQLQAMFSLNPTGQNENPNQPTAPGAPRATGGPTDEGLPIEGEEPDMGGEELGAGEETPELPIG